MIVGKYITPSTCWSFRLNRNEIKFIRLYDDKPCASSTFHHEVNDMKFTRYSLSLNNNFLRMIWRDKCDRCTWRRQVIPWRSIWRNVLTLKPHTHFSHHVLIVGILSFIRIRIRWPLWDSIMEMCHAHWNCAPFYLIPPWCVVFSLKLSLVWRFVVGCCSIRWSQYALSPSLFALFPSHIRNDVVHVTDIAWCS